VVQRRCATLAGCTRCHSGKVLDNYGWSTTAGSDVVQWSDANASNQQFQLADSPDGYVRLINRHSGMAMEVNDGSTADGGRVVQYWDWGGNNQQWQLVRVGKPNPAHQPLQFAVRVPGRGPQRRQQQLQPAPVPDGPAHPNQLALLIRLCSPRTENNPMYARSEGWEQKQGGSDRSRRWVSWWPW
jgi:hypothetical protein